MFDHTDYIGYNYRMMKSEPYQQGMKRIREEHRDSNLTLIDDDYDGGELI